MTASRIEIDTICCGKEMLFLGQDAFPCFLCLDCGSAVEIAYIRLDEDELESFRKSYSQDAPQSGLRQAKSASESSAETRDKKAMPVSCANKEATVSCDSSTERRSKEND